MKRLFLTLVMFASMLASVIALSSFVAPKQEYSQTEMNANDKWKVFREKVPYCDVEKKTCKGYGKVWVNTETFQIAFQMEGNGTKYDLSEYTGCDGYNMRFWYDGASKYYYVNIYVPKSVFE